MPGKHGCEADSGRGGLLRAAAWALAGEAPGRAAARGFGIYEHGTCTRARAWVR